LDVIPAQAGIQFWKRHETAVCLHIGEQTKCRSLYRRDERFDKTRGSIRTILLMVLRKNMAFMNLVYFEQHENMVSAITREKQIKKWNRDWKLKLIEAQNPEWQNLYEALL